MLKILLAIATLISLPAPARAEIYKCRLPDGRTEISNIPCPTGSGTLTVRPDERVPEAARRAAEQEVERMRAFVEKREAAQRADEMAEREQQRASGGQPRNVEASRPPPPRQVGNTEECLRQLEPMVLEANQRTQMEAECRSLVSPQPVYQTPPVVMPVHPQRLHISPPPTQPPSSEPPSGPKISAPLIKK